MSDVNPSIPQINEPNSTADPKIVTALNSLVSAVNNIEEANLADASVTTAKLASTAVTAPKIGTLPHVHVHGATTSMADSTYTAMTFPSETYDTEAIHSTSANTDRLTCVTPGLYAIGGILAFPANATGVRRAVIDLNGSTTIAGVTAPSATASLANEVQVTTMYRLAANDYVRLLGWQNSGGSLAAYTGTIFWMHWVGA